MCTNNPNMELYNLFRECPETAKKKITGGNLNGKTDINPMWRLKRLTEIFGPCGFGWKIDIVRTWIEDGANGEKTANVQIALRVKYNGEWSEPIPGIGGAKFVDKQSKGLITDDDAMKKAYTDAQSVACKALGIAADVYYERDPDGKYPTGGDGGNNIPPQKAEPTKSKYQIIKELVGKKQSITMQKVDEWITAKWKRSIKINALTDEQFKELCAALEAAA